MNKFYGLKDIFQSIIAPAVIGIISLFGSYHLILSSSHQILIFPLYSIALTALYFISGYLYGGILLGFITIISFTCLTLTNSADIRIILLAETLWLWGLFIVFEYYRHSYNNVKNRIVEQKDVLETNIALLKSMMQDNDNKAASLMQRIENYQSLGGIIKTLGSTLDETILIPIITELADRFIGKGSWKIKKGSKNDIFAIYIKNFHVPLIIQNLKTDNRFLLKRLRFYSLIAVPLEINDKFWGIIKGAASNPDTFDENDLRLLSVLGGLASISLNNAKLYQEAQSLAVTDGLTGLYVQKYFKERLAEEVKRSKIHNLQLSIALLDLDRFKNINDTYGHSAGDVVLRYAANLLRGRLRETDFISRYGGEEFGVIMPQTGGEEAMRVCEEIRKNIEEERIFIPVESFQPVQIRVTISIGLACLNNNLLNEEQLLAAADESLYAAKNLGRNRVESYEKTGN